MEKTQRLERRRQATRPHGHDRIYTARDDVCSDTALDSMCKKSKHSTGFSKPTIAVCYKQPSTHRDPQAARGEELISHAIIGPWMRRGGILQALRTKGSLKTFRASSKKGYHTKRGRFTQRLRCRMPGGRRPP
ncbi:hypothetical protein BO99DRAFT_223528 [Aspergillus violaceofuscus CBS 115571]|uniref:Uncharacterized protein n=1 Tax=Aspergillus violaceofuscus (strain CBS 115571) TaxID=1450538 RepID=A0A2V5HH28_ASPV1|nr:hypothetical protein BO99DRAFT_223528 [Aspergillus violaceofuscus CBS 115571]